MILNPAAGRGRAVASATNLADRLGARGIGCSTISVGASLPPLHADDLRDSDAVVVVGGDGTVHRALPVILDSGRPVYHLPHGTENLFARHFGMCSDPEKVARRIAAWSSAPMDVALVTPGEGAPSTPAAIMISAGPDASVIHRLAAARNGPITHLSYAWPIAAEVFGASLPRLTITVDGVALVSERRGMVVVANAPTYARSINPAHRAKSDDGLLDVVFLPSTSSIVSGLWLAACRFRMQHRLGAKHAAGSDIRIHSSVPFPWQVDGERGGVSRTLTIGLEPRRLRIVTAGAGPI